MPPPKSLLQPASDLDPSQVADYLAANPDFFIDRDELLRNLHLPHVHGGDVSLVERQVSLLRERNREIRKRLDAVINAGTANNETFAKCQRLVLALLEARDNKAFYEALELSFKRDFKCQAYSLIVFDDNDLQINHFTYTVSAAAARESVGALMKSKKATLGVLRPAEQEFLFRHDSEKVKSAAVLAVRAAAQKEAPGEQIALLAIGSSDAHYFQSGMGTLFLGFIADIMARQLPSRLTHY